jgi:hypothetical protein
MIRRTLTLVALIPAALAAQTTVSAAPAMSVAAELTAARGRNLPEEPIRRRVAEARLKGASEAQLAVAAHKVRVTMDAAMEAMVTAGRGNPSAEEIERGGSAMEVGYSSNQIQAIVKAAPSGRSLVVAFDVLTRLNERGVPAAKALAQVQAKLEARQSDASIDALARAHPPLARFSRAAAWGPPPRR